MKLTLVGVLIGNLLVTTYRSTPSQTDNTPFITSIGERTSISGVAISQDLLCGACRKLHKRCKHPENDFSKGKQILHYGDTLYVEGTGMRIINDVMGKYQHYHIPTKHGIKVIQTKQLMWTDVWVGSYKEEHQFHKANGIKKHQVWKVKGELK